MIDRVMLFGILGVGALLAFVIELVRRRRLREEYSLLWLGTALTMLALTAYRPLLHGFAALLGIIYPPNALFLVAIGFMLLILLHYSTVITRLTQENKQIAQQMALLRHDLEQVRGANPPTDSAP
ncbi:MAG: DUF2304 domain-containing protein [Phototrophicaceae bacterium]|jgi:hypothetical protein